MRHFDSHAYRTEDEQGVWDFAYYSMRSYKILKEKVARFHADPEIQRDPRHAGEAQHGADRRARPDVQVRQEDGGALKAHAFDAPKMAAPGFEYERLDQLTTEVLLGVR